MSGSRPIAVGAQRGAGNRRRSHGQAIGGGIVLQGSVALVEVVGVHSVKGMVVMGVCRGAVVEVEVGCTQGQGCVLAGEVVASWGLGGVRIVVVQVVLVVLMSVVRLDASVVAVASKVGSVQVAVHGGLGRLRFRLRALGRSGSPGEATGQTAGRARASMRLGGNDWLSGQDEMGKGWDALDRDGWRVDGAVDWKAGGSGAAALVALGCQHAPSTSPTGAAQPWQLGNKIKRDIHDVEVCCRLKNLGAGNSGWHESTGDGLQFNL